MLSVLRYEHKQEQQAKCAGKTGERVALYTLLDPDLLHLAFLYPVERRLSVPPSRNTVLTTVQLPDTLMLLASANPLRSWMIRAPSWSVSSLAHIWDDEGLRCSPLESSRSSTSGTFMDDHLVFTKKKLDILYVRSSCQI
jgi:hypothetical protein